MKELGITEDMIYGDLVTGKSDSYEKNGGKKLWMERYQRGRKKITARERESSSSHWDKEPSRNLSSRVSTETENYESREYPSTSVYSMRSGDTEKRLCSQSSDNSHDIEKERSTSRSLSQVSRSTTEPVHISGKKGQLTSGDSCINIQLHTRKPRASESDDSVLKGKEKYSMRTKRQLMDRRSRGNPSKRASDNSDDDKQDQKCSSRSENVLLCPSPLQSEANVSSTAAAQVGEMVNQIPSVDFEVRVPGPELVKQEPLHRIEDYDQMESQVCAQLDAQQNEPDIQTSCTSMSCTPPISAFDFERDETPPAEIVEATAEWCRTQNFPANLTSVSLQHVFQYYHSSVAVDGTKDKNESRVWHNSVWPGILQRGDQPLGQSLAATCSSSDLMNPAYTSSSQSATLQNVNPTAVSSSIASNGHIHFSTHSKPVTRSSEQANLATVLHGVPTSACKPLSSHLSNAIDGDTHQLSDGEVQEHLKMFLNKQEASAVEHSFDLECVPTRGTLVGIETTPDLTGCAGSEVDVGHCSQHDREAFNLDFVLPCHNRDQTTSTAPENHEISYFMSAVNQSGMQQEENQRLYQHVSSPTHPFNEHLPVHRESRDYKPALTGDHFLTLATIHSVEKTTASIAEDFHHKNDQERSEPAVSGNQWKEGEHKLSRSQQHTCKGLLRTEEVRYVQEPLRREKADNSVEKTPTPITVYTGRPLDLSLATEGEVNSGDTSASTFSSQTSVFQASSDTTSQICKKMSYIHEEEDGGSQLRRSNGPIATESNQYRNPSQGRHMQANHVDLASSSFPSYQHKHEKCDVSSVSQKVLNSPKQDQPQGWLCEELTAKNIDMDDDTEEVSYKKLVQDKHKSCTEQSLGVVSDFTVGAAQSSGTDVQALQSKKRKFVADKYKHLQKCYYKVSICDRIWESPANGIHAQCTFLVPQGQILSKVQFLSYSCQEPFY